MITMRRRKRAREDEDESRDMRKPPPNAYLTNPSEIFKPVSLRDRLLQREVMDLNPEILPITVRVVFPNPNVLHQFCVRVVPNEGIWKGGFYDFVVAVPEDYNMAPPKVRAVTSVWHPNIAHPGGQVCLSLLRVACQNELGWTPTRHLKDVVLGLDALFVDLVNFEDPLNTAAAVEYLENREAFFARVQNLKNTTTGTPSAHMHPQRH